MNTLMKLMLTAALLLPLTAADSKELSGMRCPDSWAYLWQRAQSSRIDDSYLRCDFTTGTCERGFGGSSRVFELLAPDRKTVIGHYSCDRPTRGHFAGNEYCIDYDAGTSRGGSIVGTVLCPEGIYHPPPGIDLQTEVRDATPAEIHEWCKDHVNTIGCP
jgi:hypothetical protein